MKLTERQKQFIRHYTDITSDTLGNATQSYIKAGYSNSKGAQVNACRLLSNPKILQGIDDYRANMEQKIEVTRNYVIQQIQKQYDKADEANDRPSALRAQELLGRSIAMFTDKMVSESMPAHERLDLDQLEELRKDAAKYTKPKLVKG